MNLHAVQDLVYARSVLMLNRRYRLFLKAESCRRKRPQTQNQCKQKKHSSNFVEWLTWVCRVSHRHPAENIEPLRESNLSSTVHNAQRGGLTVTRVSAFDLLSKA